jgi:hypothetical protein
MRALSSAAFFDSTLALSWRRWRRRRRHPGGKRRYPDQRRVALGLLAVGDHQRLGLFQRGRRFVPGRAIAGGIDLVKGLPGLHHIAFGKQAFLDDAAHLRAHFGAERGGGAAGELADYRNRLALQGDHAHFRRGLLRGRCLRIIASAKEK